MGRASEVHRDIAIDQNQGWGPAPEPLSIFASILANIARRKFVAVPPHELRRVSCRCRRQVHAGVPVPGPGELTERWTCGESGLPAEFPGIQGLLESLEGVWP